MSVVTLSSKNQVVVPKAVLKQLKWKPGQKLAVLAKGRTASYVPVPTLEELRGCAPSVNLDNIREEVDRY
ncbi:MAG: AbrB/MazE/SpoVT family DNA-binding domain-containing protein [Armatimonadetes bacterium]|nr:AbrB/MazE/SpoVT family DNA-binding domain-containing protein [Armatimonadota bacterium]